MAKDYEIREVEQLLKLKNLNDYESFFEPKIKIRGKEIYEDDDFENFNKENNMYSCNITGSEKYDVVITFKENKIKQMKCTCPYYKENKVGCKHLYALLMKVKIQENVDIIKNSTLKIVDDLKNQLYKSYTYMDNNVDRFDSNTISNYHRMYEYYIGQVNTLKKLVDRFNTIEANVDTFLRAKRTIEEFDSKYKIILSNQKVILKKNKKSKKKSSGLFSLVAESLISGFVKGISEDNKNTSLYTNEELDAWNLDEYEKEAVEKDNYDPWDFMEEEKYEHYDDDGSYND